MPTDVVAAWISFLGRLALKWSRLPTSTTDEETHLVRLSIGIASLVTTLTLAYVFAVVVPDAIKIVLQLPHPEPDVASWLKGVRYTIYFLLWLIASPLLVGALYRTRTNFRIPYLVITLFLWCGAGVGAYYFKPAEPMLIAGVIPLVVAFCPPLKDE